MSGDKPLAIDLKVEGVLPAKFAADAAAVFKNNERVEVEPTDFGLVLRAVWEFDMDCAIEELREFLGLKIEHGPPEILYRREPKLLEPVMRVRLTVPEDSIGEVIGDLTRRRCTVQEIIGGVNGYCRIDSLAPLANLFGYINILRSLTKGRGEVDVHFHGYGLVPPIGPEPDPSEPAAAALRNRRTG